MYRFFVMQWNASELTNPVLMMNNPMLIWQPEWSDRQWAQYFDYLRGSDQIGYRVPRSICQKLSWHMAVYERKHIPTLVQNMQVYHRISSHESYIRKRKG